MKRETDSSPKLKQAAKEINAILAKHDIAGLVFLHTPGHGEYIVNITPSYSCVKVMPDGYRLTAKKEDYGSADARDKAITDTSNMLNLLTVMAGEKLLPIMEMSKVFDDKVGAEHGDKPMYEPQDDNFITDDPLEFYSTVKVRSNFRPGKEMKDSKLVASAVAFNLSKNLKQEEYIKDDLPSTKAGVKLVSITLASGIGTNIYSAHHAGHWDSAEHLRYVMDVLQELFVKNGDITISTMS